MLGCCDGLGRGHASEQLMRDPAPLQLVLPLAAVSVVSPTLCVAEMCRATFSSVTCALRNGFKL